MSHQSPPLQFDLHGQNSNILELLPVFLDGLFYKQTKLDNFIDYLRTKYDFESQHLLTSLKDSNELSYNRLVDDNDDNAVNSIVKLNDEKNVLLGYLWGRIFIDAMNILNEDEAIEIKVLKEDEDGSDSKRAIDQFMQTLQFNHPIFFYVKQLPPLASPMLSSKSQNTATKLRQELLDLEYQQYLHDLNLDRFISQDTEQTNAIQQSQIIQQLKWLYNQTNHKHVDANDSSRYDINHSNIWRSDRKYVDLRNWYCDCSQYQQCYEKGNQVITGADLIAKFTASASDNDNPIKTLLKQIPSRLLDPLPMCSHILSVLILIVNYACLNHKSYIISSATV